MIDHVDWKAVADDLDELGVATVGPVLSPARCRSLTGLYDEDGRFRSTVDMARHRFGEGQYRYFDHPLPEIVAD
ncbi:MAG TPA: proline hydroxylase, partial [Acidimicrobiia bacterium]|nr:proline hydroxylase [Acidimicrobiia bacterium]